MCASYNPFFGQRQKPITDEWLEQQKQQKNREKEEEEEKVKSQRKTRKK